VGFNKHSELNPYPTQEPKKTWLDKIISFVSPKWSASRAAWRAQESQFQSIGGQRGYKSALPTRLGDVQGGSGGADFHLEQNYSRQRTMERARQLTRDNPVAAGVVSRVRENVVGCGLWPQARTKSPAWNEKAEALFKEWASEPVDTRKLFSFVDLQNLFVDGFVRDGECAGVLRDTGAIEIVEADRISAPPGKRFQPFHIDGIDLDPKTAEPKLYYIAPRRADEAYSPTVTDQPERQEVRPRFMLHFANRERASQTRGITMFASNAEWFEQLERYIEAEIAAARMAACVGLLISSPAPFSGFGTATNNAGSTMPRFDLEPGMVKELAPGEAVTQFKPEHPATAANLFITQYVRIMGLPFGLPLEMILLDSSQGSFSSIRGSFVQAQRFVQALQDKLIRHVLSRIWQWKIQQWVLSGALEYVDDWKQHSWLRPPSLWIDPASEAQAELMAIDGGLKTLSEALASRGRDLEDFVREKSYEQKLLERNNLVFARSSATRDPIPAPQFDPQSEVKNAA
jgi:lambda family phage portal protein